MSQSAAMRATRLEALKRGECLRLLAATAVGRVAFWGPDGPQVLPVNHVVLDGAVLFRTAAYTGLAQGVRDAVVAFEVDDVDDDLQTGWSVLVVGRAEYVTDVHELTEAWGQERPEPWAPGTRALVVRIVPDRITGRRIHAETMGGPRGSIARD